MASINIGTGISGTTNLPYNQMTTKTLNCHSSHKMCEDCFVNVK